MTGQSQSTDSAKPYRDVFTVSQLNREVRALLEGSLPLLWVEGEISNLARPGSGHIYFSLKDEAAQVRCAMFRTRRAHLGFTPENGMHVLLRARTTLYEPRGDYQLVVEHMEEAGFGALQRAFEALKERLKAEGLFETERKRALPAFPRCIGAVTSPSGAAIRDILTVLKRRFPSIPVVIYPVPVQGPGAAAEIAAAIRKAGRRGDCDVLVVGRGGGSLEDLWAFNEESVARAIHDSPIPVVSAVGHEVDFTISDFVADRRAPTPSAAAEMLSPDRQEWLARLAKDRNRLLRAMSVRLERESRRLQWLNKRLKHPGRRLQEIAQRVDELEQRLLNARRSQFRHYHAALTELRVRLQRHAPVHRLDKLASRNNELERRLRSAALRLLEDRRRKLSTAARALDAVSPLATLARGYAIVTAVPAGGIVRSSKDIEVGRRVKARLAEGHLICRVEETNDKND